MPSRARSIVLLGVWLGIVTGLVEAGLSLGLMGFGYLPELWFDILWVAPLVDTALVLAGAVGLAVLTMLARRGGTAITAAVAGGAFVTASTWLSLILPYQVATWALLLLSAGIAFRFASWVSRRQAAVLRSFRVSLPALGLVVVALALGIRGGGSVREWWRTSRLPDASADRPNILVIVIDALRADHVHSNGYERPTSPVLDSLSAAGASFGAAFAPAPYTAPSHASMLTGLYPHEHGVQWLERRPVMDGRSPTLPEHLLELGYRTGAFSANRFWFTREQGFGRGFLRFEDRYHRVGDMVVRTAYGRKLEDIVLKRLVDDYPWRKKAHEVTNSLLEWTTRHPGKPFFAFLNYFDVHDPYLPPEPYRSLFARKPAPGGIVNSYLDVYHPEMTDDELASEIDAYDGALRYVDNEIGRLLRILDQRGLADNLLVIITSDHGEALGEHDTFVHANSLYREEIHVPLIVWQPGRVPAGFRSETAVTIASVPATIVDLVTGEGAGPFRAPSIAALWRDSPAPPAWPMVLAEMEHWPWMLEQSPSHYGAIASVLDGRHQFIAHDSLGESFFDWRADPRQQRNLIDHEKQQEIVSRFRSRLMGLTNGCSERKPCPVGQDP